jgi:signal transduction histidine kinase
MPVSDPVNLIILVLALGLSSFATIFAWHRKSVVGARTFAFNSFIGVLHSLCLFLLVFSPTVESAFLSLRLRAILQLLANTTLVLFILDYAGLTAWLSVRRIWIFFVLPAFMIFVVLTQRVNQWFVINYSVQRQDFLLYEHYQNGPVVTLSLLYAFSLYVVMLIILGIQSVRAHPPFRWQALILFAIVAFTAFITIPSLFNRGAASPFMVSPLTLQIIFRSVLITLALFSFKFLNIMPIASHAIIDGLHTAVIVLDSRRRIVTMNRAALDLAAVTLAAAVGQMVPGIFPLLSDLFARYDGSVEINEEITFGPPRIPRHFECQLYPLVNADKRRVGHLLWLEDITERKRAEAERERLIADLEAYAHTVAHDLKSPVGVLIGFSEMMVDPVVHLDEAERVKFLETIMKTSYKMHNIIDELLLLSSVRTQSDIPIGQLDMQAIMRGVLHRLEHYLKGAGAKVTVRGELPRAIGYAPWIEEVWINYLTNAVKYGGTPPEIEIGADVQGESVRFWVRDNGPGLDAEQKSHLFEQFSRMMETRAEGHGLGLSIVHRIIEKLSGQVGADSEIGKGSTFYFVLPCSM